MIAQAEQLLQRGSSVTSSLLPAIFAIFSQWRLTGAQQMTLLGLSNEKTLYNWKSQPEKAKLTRDLLERASYILGITLGYGGVGVWSGLVIGLLFATLLLWWRFWRLYQGMRARADA